MAFSISRFLSMSSSVGRFGWYSCFQGVLFPTYAKVLAQLINALLRKFTWSSGCWDDAYFLIVEIARAGTLGSVAYFS